MTDDRTLDAAGRRTTPLSLDPETFRTLGHELVDEIARLLASVPERPVARNESPSAVREALGLTGALPDESTPADALLSGLAARLFDHSLFNGHPRFFGYITAPPAPIGVLGDFLASALNPNVGGWLLSPAASEIESQTVRWIAEFIGYPGSCGGLLVSGGNMANLVGFWAARAAKAPWDVRATGAIGPGGERLVLYASAETHTWIQKAADLSGLGTDAIRWIPTDADLRMDVGVLERRIADDRSAGLVPFMVVGTAGSVSTGVVDPIPRLAAICREHGLWFHVDGAYGGFAAASAEAPADLAALAEADSVAIDPHKWLYAPLEAGCALVRDPEHLRAAFSYHPPYYHFEERATNFVDYGPQNSRGFRALKVWLALRQAGGTGYRTMITDDIRLSRAMAAALEKHPEIQLLSQHLSIATFRFVPADLRARVDTPDAETYLNELNETLLDRLQRGGEVFVSNAVIRGRYALRACIVNFHTGPADIAAVPDIVVRAGREVDRANRPAR